MAETKSEPLCASCGKLKFDRIHSKFRTGGGQHDFQPEAAASVPSDNQVARENKDGGTACAASGLPSPSSRVGLPSANSLALVASSDDRIPCPGQPATKCACTFDEIFPDQNNVRDGICIGCGFPRAEPAIRPDQDNAAIFAKELTEIVMPVLSKMPKGEREERLRKLDELLARQPDQPFMSAAEFWATKHPRMTAMKQTLDFAEAYHAYLEHKRQSGKGSK